MAHLKLLKRLLVCAVAYAQIAGASEPLDPSEKRTWILRFEGIPVASLASAGASAEIQRKHHLGLSQRLVGPESLLKAMGLTVTYRYTRLAVGLQVVATAHQIRDAMARTDWSPRLLDASLNTILHPMMDDSTMNVSWLPLVLRSPYLAYIFLQSSDKLLLRKYLRIDRHFNQASGQASRESRLYNTSVCGGIKSHVSRTRSKRWSSK